MPRFGKQLFPCLWAYLFISGCSLQESVISSLLKGSLKYACTPHFEATALIHCCKCVVCVFLMTIFWYNFLLLIVVFFITQWFRDRSVSFLNVLGTVTEATCPSGFRGYKLRRPLTSEPLSVCVKQRTAFQKYNVWVEVSDKGTRRTRTIWGF